MAVSLTMTRPAMTGMCGRAARLVAAQFDRIAEAYRRRQARDRLASLDDRMLKDIGLTRSEIRSVVYGPVCHTRMRRFMRD